MKKIKNEKTPINLDISNSIIFIIAVSTIMGFVFRGSQLFSSFFYYIKYTSFGYELGFGFWLGHWAIRTYTEKKLNWAKKPKKANIITLLTYIIYGIIICPLLTFMFNRFVLEMSGKDLFMNVFIMSLMILSLDFIVISIFYSTYLSNKWIKSIENNEKLKRENLLAKYEALKNQVNPHFLFNSLNTLSGVVEQKPELATGFIKKLSDIYRYVLDQNDKELVLLQDEMKFAEDYIFLSKMRFGEALIFNSNLPAKITIQIVPLGLQMLVENAIKHNIIADDMPLKIEIGIEDDYVVVKNNIQHKNTIISDKEPMGLDNLKKRYAYLSSVSVEVIQSEYEFKVKLPIIKS